ncbi:MAG: hypothetical protein AVDCRST_MAG15-1434, partial [uncultured Rubellimicrobium sp.]
EARQRHLGPGPRRHQGPDPRKRHRRRESQPARPAQGRERGHRLPGRGDHEPVPRPGGPQEEHRQRQPCDDRARLRRGDGGMALQGRAQGPLPEARARGSGQGHRHSSRKAPQGGDEQGRGRGPQGPHQPPRRPDREHRHSRTRCGL